jgi:AcrR family transcriptional regulator
MASNAPRTQEDRSAATQRALLSATIECLVDYGYAGTTTRLVADHARVSRGAQTHHYPTKRDLVVAAVEQLFDQHAAAFTEAFRQVPAEQRTLDRAVEALWEIASGPTFAAILEVVVAARTDDELRSIVHGVAAALEETIIDLLLWYSPELDDRDTARRIVEFAIALVQGAAVSRAEGFGDPDEVMASAALLAPFAAAIAD